MKERGPWSTDDFELLSWHDVHVHGFRFGAFDNEGGSADLILDIDYILQWHQNQGAFAFTVCPAALRFHAVFGLRITLDYAQPTAGMCPFSIDGIERVPLQFEAGHMSYRWRIPINWPKGEIEFQAPSFTQTLAGVPRRHSQQWLDSADRGSAIAA